MRKITSPRPWVTRTLSPSLNPDFTSSISRFIKKHVKTPIYQTGVAISPSLPVSSTSPDNHFISFSFAGITGIRFLELCILLKSSLASVVSIVHVFTSSPVDLLIHSLHRPAKANNSSPGNERRCFCFLFPFSSSHCHS